MGHVLQLLRLQGRDNLKCWGVWAEDLAEVGWSVEVDTGEYFLGNWWWGPNILSSDMSRARQVLLKGNPCMDMHFTVSTYHDTFCTINNSNSDGTMHSKEISRHI